jgi:two-component system chemotaxis response regulator CheB
MLLTPGMVAVCPGGTDTILREPLPGRLLCCLKADTTAPIHPSVDRLFESAARLNRRALAIVMTGMGSDGTVGAQALAARGCPVLAQEPDECTVDGMPTSVIESGIVNEVLNVEKIGRRLWKWAGVAG